ncbi:MULTISPECIES: DUF2303 family protein [Acinetobacter]|uniref:DUF2303 family protein n=1 Tax=Acinetobacter TaxID=469 RepID=UPI0002D0CB33|nr:MULTISPECIES: DUF2303 family protein [Acinetobacter]ENW90526.1 hypothetical protein F905_00549 [Acinetobacter sp. CIP 53.82]MBA0154556.1 DUF2303 family protein [Acinetobacter indicus]
MEQAAVKQIADLAVAAQANLPVQVNGAASIAILPEGFKLHSTERFNDGRDRYRGAYQTSSISSFVEYVGYRNGSNDENVQTYIETTRGLKARTFLNLGDVFTPGHGDDTATLTLEKKAEFARFEGINGNRIRQQQLIDIVDDWADFLSAHTEQGEVELDKAIRALRKVKITKGSELDSQVRDFGHQVSALEKLEATGVDENLPHFFLLHTECYHGLNPRSVKLSLRISANNDDAPGFVLRIVGEEALNESLADEFKGILTEKLAGQGRIFQGEFTP